MRNEKTVSIFLSSGRKEKSERSFRRIRGAFAAGSMVALAALMTGCGDVPDAINPGHWWDATFGDDEDQAAPPAKSAAKPATAAASTPSSTQTAQATGPTLPPGQAPSQDSSGQQAYPKIQDVPQKPAASTLEERHKVMESLAADRANAHYTDEAARQAAAAAPAAPVPAPPAPTTGDFALSPDLATPPPKMAQAEPAAPPMPPALPEATPSPSGPSPSSKHKTYV